MDGYNIVSLKNSFCNAYKVFLILLPQVIIYKLEVFIFKDFKFNIVINISYRYKVNSLALLLLTFINLFADVYYTI